MSRLRIFQIFAFWCFATLLLTPAPTRAQQDSDLSPSELAELGEAAKPVQDLRPLRNKKIVFIFDVSGSMRSGGMLKRAREAAARIVRFAVHPGDTVELLTFGAGYDSFERKIQGGDDRTAVLQHIPAATGPDAGTNIRRPHHEALKFLEKAIAGNQDAAAIIVLTDSFNDEPKPDSAAFQDYKLYYTPGGQLLKYPPTSENRDYERLLRELVVSDRVKQYGVGVGFADNGRPIERLPQDAPPPVAPPPPSQTTEPRATKPPPPPFPYWWLLLGAGVVGLGLLTLIPLLKTTSVRVTGGAGGAKDFSIGGGNTVRIGGEGANFARDAYGVPGTKQAVATLRGSRGLLTIAPTTPKTAAAPGNPSALAGGGNENRGVRVYLNGIPLESDTPLNFGDELRVSLPTEGGGMRDVRLKFDDPRKGY